MEMTLFDEKMKLADLIRANYHLVLTLPRFGIKLGFGEKTVAEVCAGHGIPADFFLLVCNVYSFDSYVPDNGAILNTDMGFLVPYLLASHNYYLNTQLPHIEQHLLKIAEEEPSSHSAILKRFFKEYLDDVAMHFAYEENQVFPYILSLQKRHRVPDYRISTFSENHTNIEDKLNDLSQIIFKYLPEKLSDEESIGMVSDLMELLSDLNKHSMIEEKILVPYVQFLENNCNA